MKQEIGTYKEYEDYPMYKGNCDCAENKNANVANGYQDDMLEEVRECMITFNDSPADEIDRIFATLNCVKRSLENDDE